jgi:hypothetical protein
LSGARLTFEKLFSAPAGAAITICEVSATALAQRISRILEAIRPSLDVIRTVPDLLIFIGAKHGYNSRTPLV